MDKRYPPIWHRFPATFLYGFHKYPLGLAIGAGLLFALVGRWSLIASLLLIFLCTKYGVEVFRHTSRGELDPPPLNSEALTQDYAPAVKFYLLLFLMGFIIAFVSSALGPFMGMVASYFFMISLPACFMVLLMSDSLLQAVNPVLLIQMMVRMRWSYLILYGLLFILTTAWTNLSLLVANLTNPTLLIFFMYSVMFYFSVVTAHMMGYMILQESDNLGTYVVADPDEDHRLDLFDSLMRQGNHEAARLELADVIEHNPTDLELPKRMHNLALADQKPLFLVQNARQYIPRLLDAGRRREAAEVYLDCVRQAPDSPVRLSPKHTCALAHALRERKESKPAFLLLKGFHKTFPNSDHTHDAYLLGARILSEDLNRDDLAKQLLQYLLQAFPEHERKPEVQGYLQTISAMGKA